MKTEYNISRLYYLLDLYKISVGELINIISKGLKKQIPSKEILSKQIKISYLKKIDSIFNRGLNFYIDPKPLKPSNDASIFFRKTKFNSDLNIGAKKIVDQFEEKKISLSVISKIADLNIQRTIPVFNIRDDAKAVAKEVRKYLYPVFVYDKKEFLKSLISKFAQKNILIFEFVETWNKIETANVDGFFLNPNVIVLKRQQLFFRREIFTLIHELGHFLINEEEIESVDYQVLAKKNLTKIERWCSDFAYYFLAGDHSSVLENIEQANANNDYYNDLITEISAKTHLSKIALYTRLLFLGKITQDNYNTIKHDFEEQFKKRIAEERRRQALEKQTADKQTGSAPKPIISPLLISTIQTAFYGGLINEYEFCQWLKIKPEQIANYIQ